MADLMLLGSFMAGPFLTVMEGLSSSPWKLREQSAIALKSISGS